MIESKIAIPDSIESIPFYESMINYIFEQQGYTAYDWERVLEARYNRVLINDRSWLGDLQEFKEVYKEMYQVLQKQTLLAVEQCLDSDKNSYHTRHHIWIKCTLDDYQAEVQRKLFSPNRYPIKRWAGLSIRLILNNSNIEGIAIRDDYLWLQMGDMKRLDQVRTKAQLNRYDQLRTDDKEDQVELFDLAENNVIVPSRNSAFFFDVYSTICTDFSRQKDTMNTESLQQIEAIVVQRMGLENYESVISESFNKGQESLQSACQSALKEQEKYHIPTHAILVKIDLYYSNQANELVRLSNRDQYLGCGIIDSNKVFSFESHANKQNYQAAKQSISEGLIFSRSSKIAKKEIIEYSELGGVIIAKTSIEYYAELITTRDESFTQTKPYFDERESSFESAGKRHQLLELNNQRDTYTLGQSFAKPYSGDCEHSHSDNESTSINALDSKVQSEVAQLASDLFRVFNFIQGKYEIDLGEIIETELTRFFELLMLKYPLATRFFESSKSALYDREYILNPDVPQTHTHEKYSKRDLIPNHIYLLRVLSWIEHYVTDKNMAISNNLMQYTQLSQNDCDSIEAALLQLQNRLYYLTTFANCSGLIKVNEGFDDQEDGHLYQTASGSYYISINVTKQQCQKMMQKHHELIRSVRKSGLIINHELPQHLMCQYLEKKVGSPNVLWFELISQPESLFENLIRRQYGFLDKDLESLVEFGYNRYVGGHYIKFNLDVFLNLDIESYLNSCEHRDEAGEFLYEIKCWAMDIECQLVLGSVDNVDSVALRSRTVAIRSTSEFSDSLDAKMFQLYSEKREELLRIEELSQHQAFVARVQGIGHEGVRLTKASELYLQLQSAKFGDLLLELSSDKGFGEHIKRLKQIFRERAQLVVASKKITIRLPDLTDKRSEIKISNDPQRTQLLTTEHDSIFDGLYANIRERVIDWDHITHDGSSMALILDKFTCKQQKSFEESIVQFFLAMESDEDFDDLVSSFLFKVVDTIGSEKSRQKIRNLDIAMLHKNKGGYGGDELRDRVFIQ